MPIHLTPNYPNLESDFLARELKNITIISYNVDSETCVVLDGTSGEYGYPGFNPSDLTGERVAIDPMTKEIVYLQ